MKCVTFVSENFIRYATTKRMCSRKFLQQVLCHSLVKLSRKYYENRSILAKVTAKKKTVAPFLFGNRVEL